MHPPTPPQQNANVPTINNTVHSLDHFLLLIWGVQETTHSIAYVFSPISLEEMKMGG